MAKAKEKKAPAKKVDLSGYGTKPYEKGSKKVVKRKGDAEKQHAKPITILTHTGGNLPGTAVEILEVKHDGAMFRVKALSGPRFNKEFLVWANQLS